MQFIGKFKDAVGFKSAAAKKPGSTFVRGRAESVSNPKTYAQALQRAKTVPAAIFYSAFESVENHAFLPSGNRSRNQARFRSLAMRNESIPDVRKGEQVIPCIDYQISEGSLGLSSKTFGQALFEESVLFPQLKYGVDSVDVADIRNLTVGAFSQQLINANVGLAEGMELTFMAVLLDKQAYETTGSTKDRIAAHFSVVLNTADTITTMDDVISPLLNLGVTQGAVYITHYDENEFALLSAGLIISEKTQTSWRYTNSRMTVVDPDFVDTDGVVESYMSDSSSRSSDKILQQADNSSSSIVAPVSGTTVDFQLSPAIEGATLSATKAAVAVMSSGERRVVTRGGALLAVGSDGQLTPITKTVADVTSSVLISETTLAGNRTITEQEAAGVPFSDEPVTHSVYKRTGTFQSYEITLLVNEEGKVLTGSYGSTSYAIDTEVGFEMVEGPIQSAIMSWGYVDVVINNLDTHNGSFTYNDVDYTVSDGVVTPEPANYPG